MSSSDEHQEHPSTLPSPELNPLTNPVLGRNMGRWAEVYFTSAPEKREQAVRDLLRELESGSPVAEALTPATMGGGAPVDSPLSKATGHAHEETPAVPAAISGRAELLREEFIQCSSCGRLALAEQKFCAACGSALPVRMREEEPGQVEFGAGEPEEVREENPAEKTELLASPLGLPSRFDGEEGHKPIVETASVLFEDHELSRRRGSRGRMALALAILAGTLIYVAARETAAWLRSYRAARAATAASTARPAPQSSAKKPEEVTQAAQLPQNTIPDHSSAHTPNALSPTPQAGKASVAVTRDAVKQDFVAVSSSQKTSEAASGAGGKLNSPADVGGHGTEELAIAESYLSGTQGKSRDSSQAAQWLWKSVAKENAAAALLLSDLYVTGDGVPQNCDQARLLLDAAARKETPGAGERIRDLPNLGCE